MKKPIKKHYTVKEAAKRLHVTRAAIHRAITKGYLPAQWGTLTHVVKTRALLIPAESLRKFKIDKAQQKRGKKSADSA